MTQEKKLTYYPMFTGNKSMLSCNATKRTQSIPQLSHNILCSYRNREYRLFSNFWRFNEIAVGGCVRYKR